MGENLYNFESLYSRIKSIFHPNFNNIQVDSKYNSVFKTIKGQYSEIDDSFESNCNKAIAYLKYLEEEYQGEIDTAKGSIYLYSWLCDVEFNNSKYNKKGLDIYRQLLQAYAVIDSSSNIPGIFGNYLKDNIDDNLKNLYDLYYKFDKFINKQKCGDSYCKCAEDCADLYNKYMMEHCGKADYIDFCKELQKFEKMYNVYIEKHDNCRGNKKILLISGNSYIRVILTPILVISIITFIIFFLLKFSPLGSRLCLRSKNKKKKWNSVDEEIRDIRNPSKTFHSTSKTNPYNLGYHSVDHTP